MPKPFTDPDALAEAVIAEVGRRIVLGLPLGLGKANHIANALYQRAAKDPSVELHIFTALTLEAPVAKSELEHRFIDPISKRLIGGYPALDYAVAGAPKRAAAERPRRRVLFSRRTVDDK